jgi:hypothetical protein
MHIYDDSTHFQINQLHFPMKVAAKDFSSHNNFFGDDDRFSVMKKGDPWQSE